MISRVHKSVGSGRLVSYLLRPTKNSQIVESSLYSPLMNQLIAEETVILDPAVRSIAAAELNNAFTMINGLNPKVTKNMMHLIIAFDPKDGELSPSTKGQIARDIVERIGYGDTYWVAVNHGRDDPEHGHVHDHDHLHILAARIDCNCNAISDSWDFIRINKALRVVEEEYELNPYEPFWEREFTTPEIHWSLQPQSEIPQPERRRQLSRSM